jgi:hypothetical protein
LAVAAATGCGGGNNTESSSKTSSTSAASPTSAAASGTPSAGPPSGMYAPPGDYAGLLIKASDLGSEFTAPNPPVQDPNGPGLTGVGQSFTNADGSNQVTGTITLFVNPATAASVASTMKDELSKDVPGAPVQPIDVGTNGQMIAGMTADKSKAETDLTFAEGKAVVFLQFHSAPNDPVPSDFALAVARKQDDIIKNGLPS